MQRIHLFTVCAVFIFWVQNLSAHCSLNFCPRHEEASQSVQLSLAIHQVGFDLEKSGYYSELLPQVQYLGIKNWAFSAIIPIVRLDIYNEVKVGLGNPLLSISRGINFSSSHIFSLGTQLEFPFGDDENGIGSTHWMLLPFMNYMYMGNILETIAGFGFSTVLSDHHDHEEAMPGMNMAVNKLPLYVQPHEDHELLYRLAIGKTFSNTGLRPELKYNGQYAFGTLEGAGRNHQSIGLAVAYKISSTTLTPSIESALGKNARFNWNAGLEVKRRF